VFGQQEGEVVDAMLHDHLVREETVEEYVEHVYAWATDERITNDRGQEVDPDPLKMKVFETEHLGRFDDGDYENSAPSADVEAFRREKVITALNRYAWENRGDDFAVDDVDLTAIPVIQTVLESHDWDDVARVYEDFDPRQWDDPPTGTETETVKAKTIDHMVDELGYSASSAELTTRHVMGQVSYKWD
jgi:predicted Ser/Thr protein kinase